MRLILNNKENESDQTDQIRAPLPLVQLTQRPPRSYLIKPKMNESLISKMSPDLGLGLGPDLSLALALNRPPTRLNCRPVDQAKDQSRALD